MTLWKINDKHLNCMITEEEIKEMGYQLSDLKDSKEKTEEFLNVILENGKKLFELDTKEGIKSFNATLLQNKCIFLSISCAGPDEEIDKSLEEISSDMEVIKKLTSKENMDRLRELKGPEKAQEFGNFVANLKQAFQRHNKPMEQIEIEFEKDVPEKEVPEKQEKQSSYNIKFSSLDQAIDFCHYYRGKEEMDSRLFHLDDQYYLVADLKKENEDHESNKYMLYATEFGGEFEENSLVRSVMEEHGECLIKENAFGKLKSID